MQMRRIFESRETAEKRYLISRLPLSDNYIHMSLCGVPVGVLSAGGYEVLKV
jgi:hypothetical protein